MLSNAQKGDGYVEEIEKELNDDDYEYEYSLCGTDEDDDDK
jgi:hypothetical protein